MSSIENTSEEQAAVRNNLSAIFVSLELSRSKWLVTLLSPDGGEKMSKHQMRGGKVMVTTSRYRHRRTHPRQDRRLEEEGHVDGRYFAAGL